MEEQDSCANKNCKCLSLLACSSRRGYNKRGIDPYSRLRLNSFKRCGATNMVETVQLFVTCILDTLYPRIGESVVHVLERAGVQVAFPPGQTCCGQPAFNAGLRNQARPVAQHTIEVFERTQGPVVVPSGSCAAMIRHGYLELLADDSHWLPRACTGGAHLRVQ